MYRNFGIEQYCHQCFSTCQDLGKGKQMPVHYGSKDLNFITISSPLGTQMPQGSEKGRRLDSDEQLFPSPPPSHSLSFFPSIISILTLIG